MRVTENMTANNAIYNINKSQNRLNKLNELLASNQNINRPSDDPIATRQLLDLQVQVNSIDQYMSNISNGKNWVNVANTALQGMNELLTQAKSAASNILAGTNDSVSVTNALNSLENVRQQLSDMANVQVGDQYVFGGYNNSAPVISNKTLGGVVDPSRQPNQIAGIDTTGLIVGMTVSGKGIVPNTTITSIDTTNNTVTLSKNPISSGSGLNYTFGFPPTTQTGNTSLNLSQSQITGISTVGLTVGDLVTGPGVPPGATIASIDNASQITLTQPLTQAVTGGAFNFVPRIIQTGGNAVSGSSTITDLVTTGFHIGGAITGPGIPTGTTVLNFVGSGPGSTVTLSQPLTQGATGTTTFAFTPTLVQTGNADTATTKVGYAVNGASKLTALSDISGLQVGATVTGPGVQPGTTITSLGVPNPTDVGISLPMTQDVTYGTFSFTNPSNNVITGVDTSNLTVGDTVTGPGVPLVPPGIPTTIAAIGPGSQITLNQALTQPVSGGTFTFTPAANTPVGTQVGTTSFTSKQVTGLDTTNLSVGLMVSGPGIPSGTTILSVDSASQITLSQPLTQAVTGGTFSFSPTVSKIVNSAITSTNIGTNTITGLLDTAGLSVGMAVSGPGIPENTKITGIGPGTTLSLNNNATQTTAGGTFTFGPNVTKTGTANPPNQITGLPLAQLKNLYIGMKVSGPGIPANTTITDIDTTDTNGTGSVTLSNIPTGPVGAGNFVFEGYFDSYSSRTMNGTTTAGSATVSGLTSTANMMYAPAVSKAGSTNPTVNPNQITGLPDTNGLTVGMMITDNAGGTIIPPNTIVTGIDPAMKTITLSNPLTPPTVKAGTALAGANTITGLADVANLYVGMPLSDNANGTIIPPNTTITSISAGPAPFSIGISQNTIAAAPAGTNFSFAPTTLKAATQVSFNFMQPIAKTGATTIFTNQITGLGDTSNLFVGMPVSDNAGGTIIPANTTIAAIDPITKTVSLSNNSLATAPAGTKFFFTPTMPKAGATNPGLSPNMITGLAATTNLFVGMPVTGPGIPANTTITGTPASIPPTAAGTVTLSNNPTVAISAGTFYFGQNSSMTISGAGIAANSTVGAIVSNNSVNLSTAATATSPVGGTQLTLTGYFANENVTVNINKSSQVALNYSGTKLLLGGAPPAATQSSGPPPSTLPVNILGTIGELMTAIQNKDDAGIVAAASNLKTATEQVNLAQTEYAGRAARLDSAQTMLTNNQNTLKDIISSKQTLDTAKTIVQLQQQTTAYQAALQGTAKIMPLSLLDYLK